MRNHRVRKEVRERYAAVAGESNPGCATNRSCCGTGSTVDVLGRLAGYTDRDLRGAPAGSNLGLGCGNPTALASLGEGETVLDLGCGAGFDCFLAAGRVGSTGKVIGVDMTPAMLDRARKNAGAERYAHVEFRLGEIENIPAADGSVDVVISNCVVNLSPDKERVFREAFRVLRAGGRLMVSDIVLERELPEVVRSSAAAWSACIAGAALRDDYLDWMRRAGFQEVTVLSESRVPFELVSADPVVRGVIDELNLSPEEAAAAAAAVVSISVLAFKGGEGA